MPRNQHPWFNFFSGGTRSESTETFYDATQIGWAVLVEREWKVIAGELASFIGSNESDLKSFYNNQPKWKSFGLYAWGMCLSEKRCSAFPETLRIIRQVPDVVTVMVGVMEPHSEIHGHYGDTDAIYRCHLPIVVPGKLPEIGFQVEDEKKAWEEGRLMIFNDARYHRGWNDTGERRVVLIFDVIKPEYRDKKLRICIHVLTGLAFQKLVQKLRVPKKLIRAFIFTFILPVKTMMAVRFAIEKTKRSTILK